MRIVLLNGPRRVGKDTAARAIAAAVPAVVIGQSHALKRRVHAAYHLRDDWGQPLEHDAFEDRKDEPAPEFLGRTPREACIAFSEAFMKPLHGEEVFGHILAAELLAVSGACRWAVVPDSRFAPEAFPLIRAFGAPNILLIRLHGGANRPRPWDEDSGGHIDLPGVLAMDLCNDVEGEAGMRAFGDTVVATVRAWAGGDA